MADQIFENTRLVNIYDAFDGHRRDLELYLNVVNELGAKSVLDIGCGTGNFACLLASKGYDVIGVDPANASLDFAQKKEFSDKVQWILGDSRSLPKIDADMAVMTGNVAQVFVTDELWLDNLSNIKQALRHGGHLVFEARDPAQKAWENWTPQKTRQRLNLPGIGYVECWCDVLNVSDSLVTFRWTYNFESDGQTLTSDSVLRFREKDEIASSLEKCGYQLNEIRDAPDRPRQEFIFIAKSV